MVVLLNMTCFGISIKLTVDIQTIFFVLYLSMRSVRNTMDIRVSLE